MLCSFSHASGLQFAFCAMPMIPSFRFSPLTMSTAVTSMPPMLTVRVVFRLADALAMFAFSSSCLPNFDSLTTFFLEAWSLAFLAVFPVGIFTGPAIVSSSTC